MLQCTYPLGTDGQAPKTFQRKFSELPSSHDNDFGMTVPTSQLELQNRARSRMRRQGLLQSDAKGRNLSSDNMKHVSDDQQGW